MAKTYSRPNIVLFLTDDHAPWTLPCAGNSEVRAPNIDRLATEGVLFRNAFTPTPVCSPARACVLTGLNSSQHGVHDWVYNGDPKCAERDWLAGQTTVAELLGRSGYHCGLSGKWHLGFADKRPRGYHWARIASNGPHNGAHQIRVDGEWIEEQGNRTALITDNALEFLNETPEDRPFFLQVGYVATHSPYTGHDPELVASYTEATFRDIRRGDPHPWSWNEGFPEGTTPTADQARERHANHYAAVTEIDHNIGRILAALEASGHAEDTVVIYTSDHGLSLGQAGFWGKGNGTRPLNMHETSIRVPLIMWGGPMGRGVSVDQCVDHLDTFQTVCDLGGVEPGWLRDDAHYAGRTLLPFVSGRAVEDWDSTRYGEYGDLRMVRTPRWKLVRRYPNGPDDLFDLESDPLEHDNLVDNPQLGETRAELERRLQAFYSRHDDPGQSGLRVKELPRHNLPQKPSQKNSSEAWRDGIRESRGLQLP